MMSGFKHAIRAPARLFARFRRDRTGVGAVEFAIVFPILLALYITAFELTIGFSIYKRTTHAAGTIADLVSQQTNVNEAYLTTMEDVAAAIFVPYTANNLKLKISGIQVDANRIARITWAWDEKNGRPYAVNSIVEIPANLKQPNAFFIHAELSVDHTLLMFMSSLSTTLRPITIGRDYYFAKRQDNPVTCSNC